MKFAGAMIHQLMDIPEAMTAFVQDMGKALQSWEILILKKAFAEEFGDLDRPLSPPRPPSVNPQGILLFSSDLKASTKECYWWFYSICEHDLK